MTFHASARVLPVFLVAALACGGGDSRPGPLRTTMDDMYLASIPMDQKSAVLQAQNDYAKAKMEFANADNGFQEAKSKIKVAENEYKSAKLEKESAKAQQADAKRTAEVSKMKASERELKIADAKLDAARAKIDAWKERRKALKVKRNWAEDNMYAAEARYELSKARLAKQNGIAPAGFDHAKFEEQSQQRSRRAQETKQKVDRAMAKAKAKWDKYKAAESKVSQTAGR